MIGYGHIGKRHVEEINANPHAEVVAICDSDPDRLAEAKQDKALLFSSLDSFIASGSEADIVNICTPNGLHAKQVIRSLQAGYNVICEKPLALKTEDCTRIIKAEEASGRKVICVMQNRFSPPSVLLKNAIENSVFGQIYFVQINLFWNRDHRYYKNHPWHGSSELDGGVLFTQFSHFIDLLYWVFGDISNITSQFYNFNHRGITEFADSGIILFDLECGGKGSVNFTTSVANNNMESSITVIGEKGSLKISGQYMNQLEYFDASGIEKPELDATKPANNYGQYTGSAANHQEVINNAVAVFLHGAKACTSIEDGAKTVEIIERIYRS